MIVVTLTPEVNVETELLMKMSTADLWSLISGALGVIASALAGANDDGNADAGPEDVARAVAGAGSVISALMTSSPNEGVFDRGARGALAVQFATLGLDADYLPGWVVLIRDAVLSSAGAAYRAGHR